MESPIAVAMLVAWCSALAAVVCGGEILSATSEAWHTSSGDCDHVSGADQVYQTPLKISNRRLRCTLNGKNRQKILLNNMTTFSPSAIPNNQRFIIIEARIKGEKVTCFVDGGAERSLITRALHEKLKLDAAPYETTIMGVGGAATTVPEESKVLLRLGKREKAVRALV